MAYVENSWDELSDLVVNLMDEHAIPGMAIGMLYGGQSFSAGFGVTHIDHPLPVTPETLFQVGSISKTFTGTAIMRLVELGKVDLDAPIRTYVPDFRVVDETATCPLKTARRWRALGLCAVRPRRKAASSAVCMICCVTRDSTWARARRLTGPGCFPRN